MLDTKKEEKKEDIIQKMFELGAHLGFSRRRRHPSVSKYIYGYKNNAAIIDLEHTTEALKRAEKFVAKLGQDRATLLFVGNKPEAQLFIKKVAVDLELPYVAERWIGGTLTNFKEIRKRVNKLQWIKDAEKSDELAKYKKKERLLFAKEKKDLERYFGGITSMDKLPKALFVLDSGMEDIAVAEARLLNIPIVALVNSDCNITNIDYPIVANDTASNSIDFFIKRIADAYKTGLATAPKVVEDVKEQTKLNEKKEIIDQKSSLKK